MQQACMGAGIPGCKWYMAIAWFASSFVLHGVLSHVTVCCHMLRCAVTCYGVMSHDMSQHTVTCHSFLRNTRYG